MSFTQWGSGQSSLAQLLEDWGGGDYQFSFFDLFRRIKFGTDDNDHLTGTRGSDLMFGGRGNDTLIGDKGNDKLFGGKDNDLLDGGMGKDWLFGGEGDDTLEGGRHNDLLFGGEGKDRAVFSGNFEDYEITMLEFHGVEKIIVKDLRKGRPDGIDILVGVEILEFADKVIEPGNEPAVAVDDEFVTTDAVVRGAPFMVDVTANDEDPEGDPINVAEILDGTLEFTLPENFSIDSQVENPLGPNEVLNVDVTLFDSDTFLSGTFNLTVGTDGKATVTVRDAVPFNSRGVPFSSMDVGDAFAITFDYRIANGVPGEDTATATITIDGTNQAPIARAVNIVMYEQDGAFGSKNESYPIEDFESFGPIFDPLVTAALDDPSAFPAEANLGDVLFFNGISFGGFGNADDATHSFTASSYTVTDAGGLTATADVSLEFRGKDVAGALDGVDDPDVVDMLFDFGTRDSLLRGFAGDDRLDGFGGNDTLEGGDGNDFMVGGPGDDSLDGGDGNDFVDGGDGADIVRGGAGDDSLADGFDFIAPSDAPDTLIGGQGNDFIGLNSFSAVAGSDRIVWEAGDADGSTDTVSGFDNTSVAQDILDVMGILNGATLGTLGNFLNITNDGVDTTITVDTDGGGVYDDLTIVLQGVADGSLANLEDNFIF